MFSFITENYRHEIIHINNKYILIDITYTPDCKWEGAYSILNEEKFAKIWCDEFGNDSYTENDIFEYAEDFEAFEGFIIVSSYHRTPTVAEKRVLKAISKI